MSARPESTLGYERRTNALFGLEEDAFVRTILESVPEMPRYYPRMKALNARGADGVDPMPGARALTVAEVVALRQRPEVVVLDVRGVEAFADAHVPGAIHIGAGPNLSMWAGWLLEGESRGVLVSDAGDDEASRRTLVRVGLDGVEGFLEGGVRAWMAAGEEVARLELVTANEVAEQKGELLVVDVRSDAEWRTGHVDGAQHWVLGELVQESSGLERTRPMVTMCGSGYRSSMAASLLLRAGFCDVKSTGGGMTAWRRAALPVAGVAASSLPGAGAEDALERMAS